MRGSTAIFAAILSLNATLAAADTETRLTLPSGVTVKIVEAAFLPKLFKVTGCSEESAGCLINGHVPFGVAFGLPKTYVKSIVASYRGHTYSLSVRDMYNAWGKRPLEHKGVIRYFGGSCTSAKNCQFRGVFSDGAGSFVAEWKIVNGMATRTVLSDSDDIVDLFEHHIDPPVLN